MSTSCGVPASLLSKAIWNGLSAGALSVFLSKVMFCAVIVMPPGPPEPAGPDGAGPPPEPPTADFGGNQPALIATAATTRNANSGTRTFGQPGAGPLSRCPVWSACTVRLYSFRASLSQPSRETITASRPTARIQPGK